MEISFTPDGWSEYQYWLTTDRKLTRRINALIKEIQRHPFEGTGKPEALRGNWSGFWSQRITQEHRLVYEVKHGRIIIHQCRHHY